MATHGEYRKNKRAFHHSSKDHPRVTKGHVPCHHPETLHHSALNIQPFACTHTTSPRGPSLPPAAEFTLCAATPGHQANRNPDSPFWIIAIGIGHGCIFSQIETERANGHNPQRYLSVLLTELANVTAVEQVKAPPWNLTPDQVAERYAAYPPYSKHTNCPACKPAPHRSFTAHNE